VGVLLVEIFQMQFLIALLLLACKGHNFESTDLDTEGSGSGQPKTKVADRAFLKELLI
jgi:hypothetical protein